MTKKWAIVYDNSLDKYRTKAYTSINTEIERLVEIYDSEEEAVYELTRLYKIFAKEVDVECLKT